MFYVYEHWRTDRDECFYVGKGHAGRAYSFRRRNRHHKAIVAKLSRTGFAVEVRIVESDLTEERAFELEIERISFWRNANVDLANISSGGGRASLGVKLTEERKKQIGEQKRNNKYRLGAKLSPETKEKIRKAHIGKVLSEEHKEKLRHSLSGDKNPFFGKKHSKESTKGISEANRKRIWSEESKAKLTDSLKKRPPRKLGNTWKLSEETKRRQSEGAKKRWEKRRLENAS